MQQDNAMHSLPMIATSPPVSERKKRKHGNIQFEVEVSSKCIFVCKYHSENENITLKTIMSHWERKYHIEKWSR